MLEVWLFPVLDYASYPLFLFPNGVSLTVVSVLTGILMIWLYWLTSDQWYMAHQKRRIKVAQNKLMRGDYSRRNLSDLILGNLNLSRIAFIPAIVTVLLILVLIPWVGSRFGYRTPAVREPFKLQVTAPGKVSLETSEAVRHTILRAGANSGTTVRLMGLEKGRHHLTLKTTGSEPFSFSVGVGETSPPHWPDISRFKWYHNLVKPAGITLPETGSINSVTMSFVSVFGFLGFTFFGTYLPGWLTYYFVVSFLVGVYFKFRYSIE